MLPTQLLNEMERRAKHSPLFQRWLHIVMHEEPNDDQLTYMTMELAIALDDQVNKYREALANILREADKPISRPTGVAESMSQLHDLNQAIAKAYNGPPTQHPNNLPPFSTEED